MPVLTSTGRVCACGEEIRVTEKTAIFGATHNRDPKTWPARCAYCVLDTTIAMFASIGRPDPLPDLLPNLSPPKPICAFPDCGTPLGAKFYSDAKYVTPTGKRLRGDICLACRSMLPSWAADQR
jgi:hypothetical protein